MRFLFFAILSFCALPAIGQSHPEPPIVDAVDILIREYRFSEALTLIEDAGDSVDINLLQRKGLCYGRLGSYPEAIAVYERIVATDSMHRESLYQLGQLYARSEQYTRAMNCFARLTSIDSTNSFYYKQYASIAVKAEDLAGAISGYMRAVALNPRDLDAYAQLAGMLLELQQFHTVDSMLTDVLTTRENKQLRMLLARANYGAEDYNAVVNNIGRILTTSDTTTAYARLLGISYFQMEDYQNVIRCMEFLLREGVEADWIYYYLGASYHQLDNPVKGVEFLNIAIEKSISERIGTYYTQLAMAYEELKDYPNAIRSYKAAYERSRSDILLYHLARNYDVYYEDKNVARMYYQKYLNSQDTIRMARRFSLHRVEILSDLK